jgi:hypothetical protein
VANDPHVPSIVSCPCLFFDAAEALIERRTAQIFHCSVDPNRAKSQVAGFRK